MIQPTPTVAAGLTVAVTAGAAPRKPFPIVFIHGSGGGAWTWEAFQPWFGARGWTSYAPNLRGHHGSKPADPGRIGIEDHLSDLQELLQALGPAVLIGHSLGGLLALKLAERLSPPALVALAPAPPRGFSALGNPALVGAFLRHLPAIVSNRPVIPSPNEAARLTLNAIPAEHRAAVYRRGVPQSGRTLFQISITGVAIAPLRRRIPMLLVAGTEDRMVPAASVCRVARTLGAEYHEHPGVGHVAQLEPHWRRVAADIADWLDRVLAPSPAAAGPSS